jgi:hypothetical protein
MQYQLYKNPFTGEIDEHSIFMIDDSGQVSWVPDVSRFWQDYQDWLAAGNTPLPAQ